MSDRTEPTVEVPVAELEDLRDLYSGTIEQVQGVYAEAGCNIQGGWGDCDTIEALIARIPEPEWEPSHELIDRFVNATPFTHEHRSTWDVLRAIHAAGIDLTLREDSDHE